MALNPNFSELATVTLNRWASRKFADVYTSHCPLWMKIRMRGNVMEGGFGISILEPLKYPVASGPQPQGITDPYNQLTPSETTGWTAAQYTPAEYVLDVSIPEYNVDLQGSETERINHLQSVMEVSMDKFLNRLNVDLWAAEGANGSGGNLRSVIGSVRTYFNRGSTASADGGASPASLSNQIGTATGTSPVTTVGGIDRTSANGGSYWCTPLFTTTVSTITLGKLNNVISLAIRNADSPDLIVTTRANYDSIMEILQGYQRFEKSALADAGFDAMRYRSCDIVFDDNCPATNLFVMNTKYLNFRALSMKPRFKAKDDPYRQIYHWEARMVCQLTSGHLGRVHSRATSFGA